MQLFHGAIGKFTSMLFDSPIKEPDLSHLSAEKRELVERIVKLSKATWARHTVERGYASDGTPTVTADTTVLLQILPSKSWSHVIKLADIVIDEFAPDDEALAFANAWKKNVNLMLEVHKFKNYEIYLQILQDLPVKPDRVVITAKFILGIINNTCELIESDKDKFDKILFERFERILTDLTTLTEEDPIDIEKLRRNLKFNVRFMMKTIVDVLISHGRILLADACRPGSKIKQSPNAKDLFDYINNNQNELMNGIVMNGKLNEDKLLVRTVDRQPKRLDQGVIELSFSCNKEDEVSCKLVPNSQKMSEGVLDIIKTAIPVITYQLSYAYQSREIARRRQTI